MLTLKQREVIHLTVWPGIKKNRYTVLAIYYLLIIKIIF